MGLELGAKLEELDARMKALAVVLDKAVCGPEVENLERDFTRRLDIQAQATGQLRDDVLVLERKAETLDDYDRRLLAHDVRLGDFLGRLDTFEKTLSSLRQVQPGRIETYDLEPGRDGWANRSWWRGWWYGVSAGMAAAVLVVAFAFAVGRLVS